MKNEIVFLQKPVDGVVAFVKANRSVKAEHFIEDDKVGNWNFHDEFHQFEILIRNKPFFVAADEATKSYCQQRGTKFARLYV